MKNNQDNQNLDAKKEDLFSTIRELSKKLEKLKEETKEQNRLIDDKIEKSVNYIDKACLDLDQLEEDFSKKLDEIIIEEVRDLEEE